MVKRVPTKASRAELARLSKVLDDPDYGPSLFRLPKRDQRRVLDLLGDDNRSRNRIKDAQNLIDEITKSRSSARRESRAKLRDRLARKLRTIWGKYPDGAWRANLPDLKFRLNGLDLDRLQELDAVADSPDARGNLIELMLDPRYNVVTALGNPTHALYYRESATDWM